MIGVDRSIQTLAIRQARGLSENFAGDIADWPLEGGERNLTGEVVDGHPVWRAKSADGAIHQGPFQETFTEIQTGVSYDIRILAKQDVDTVLWLHFAGSNLNPFSTLLTEWRWLSETVVAGANQIVEVRAADFIKIAAIEIRESK